MKKSNVKIGWQFADAFIIEFDFDDGDYRYSYRPEDGEFDVDPESKRYDQAEWLLVEDEYDSLADYMRDQADQIIRDIDAMIKEKHQNGYADMAALLERTQYSKVNA